jgi:signal transduction histidine kinase
MTSHAPVEAGVSNRWPDRFAARADHWLTRVGLTSSFQRDCALAVLVILVSIGVLLALFADPVQVAVMRYQPFHVAAVIVVTSAQALLLCIRRVNPVLCIWVVSLLQVVILAVLPSGDSVHGLTPFIAAYTCGALLPARRAVRVVTAVAAFEIAGFAVVYFVPGLSIGSQITADAPGVSSSILSLIAGHLLSSVLTYVGAAVVGAYVTTRRQYVELVRVRAAEAIEAQRARADAAIGLERSRMARELHDIAAHHLSGMVVQTAVVERLIDRDPQAAKEAAAWIRGQGKETLHNLRLVVGALREPEETPGDGAPVPGLAVLDRLVRAARELGTRVDFEQEGEPRALPPIADVTFYRVTQEALSNARDHAPGAPVRVRLRYLESDVSLDVVNEAGRGGPASQGHRGYGLVGMRERAQMIGAEFDAGPSATGGWRVTLTLPLDRETTEITTAGVSATI